MQIHFGRIFSLRRFFPYLVSAEVFFPISKSNQIIPETGTISYIQTLIEVTYQQVFSDNFFLQARNSKVTYAENPQ